jgi:hypothetical protein
VILYITIKNLMNRPQVSIIGVKEHFVPMFPSNTIFPLQQLKIPLPGIDYFTARCVKKSPGSKTPSPNKLFTMVMVVQTLLLFRIKI